MKHILFFCSVVVIASIVSCTTDHSLSPEYECNVPSTLNNAKTSSSWIYKRTLLDAQGNPLRSQTSSAIVVSFDTLTLIGRDVVYTKAGLPSLKFEDRYSNDGGLTYQRDTVYWVVTPSEFYVNNLGFQNQLCNCFYRESLKWRVYEDCNKTSQKTIDTTFLEPSFPAFQTDGSTTYVSVEDGIKNLYLTYGNEAISVNGESISTKKSQSLLMFSMKIISPNAVTFSNGRRTNELSDDRTVWTNRNIGIIKERSMSVDNTNPGAFNIPHSFERILVTYTIIN